jgi:hypothetical protein
MGSRGTQGFLQAIPAPREKHLMQEPPKKELLAFAKGAAPAPPRQAFCILQACSESVANRCVDAWHAPPHWLTCDVANHQPPPLHYLRLADFSHRRMARKPICPRCLERAAFWRCWWTSRYMALSAGGSAELVHSQCGRSCMCLHGLTSATHPLRGLLQAGGEASVASWTKVGSARASAARRVRRSLQPAARHTARLHDTLPRASRAPRAGIPTIRPGLP